jgi:hypothetical protein
LHHGFSTNKLEPALLMGDPAEKRAFVEAGL